MGRPPTHGAPSFRFFHAEVAEMEALLRAHSGHVPPRELLMSLANKFSNSQERSGKIAVQMKQVWNWFQNRRYALRSKLVKPPGNPNMPPNPRDEASQIRNVQPVPQQPPVPSGHNLVRNMPENLPMEFEAKSARDGAWYDVQLFLSHRNFDTGNPEVLVRFSGFGPEEDEWVIVLQNVRQRSLPCESSECVAVIPGDLILCFQEGKEQALYFDAHVLDAQRRRHDVRGCRCRFLVRYDHDQTEEIVPLRKVCRRPETDHRLQQLHAAIEASAAAAAAASTSASASASVTAESKKPVAGPNPTRNLRMTNPNPSAAVTVPPPTITNVTAQTLMSASSSTPISASTPPSNLTSAPTLISAPSPSSVTVSAPIPTPISAATPSSILTSAPTPSPSSISAPTPSSTLVSAPSPSSAPISAPTLFSVPSPSPSSIPTFTPSSSSAPVSALLSPTPASAPLPTSISDPSPSSALISAAPASPALISAPSPTPAPTLTSISASTLAPAFAPSFSPVVAPVPTPTPTPGPVPISSSIPAAAPESKRLGSDDSGTSADGASAQEKIFNSGVADIVGEAKKEEIHSDLETSMVIDENSVSQKEINDKPTAPVPEPEKAGISAPSEPTMAVSASTTDDGLTISTEEMRNLTVSETRE